jgi:hypothetical protein
VAIKNCWISRLMPENLFNQVIDYEDCFRRSRSQTLSVFTSILVPLEREDAICEANNPPFARS